MNNTRRKTINQIMEQLELIKGDIENLTAEERDCYDNLPESFRYGEKGERMEEAIDNLESAFGSLEDAIDYLSEAIEC